MGNMSLNLKQHGMIDYFNSAPNVCKVTSTVQENSVLKIHLSPPHQGKVTLISKRAFSYQATDCFGFKF